MITKEELDQVLHFVSKRWIDMSRDPNHKAFENMPTDFWMNSMGGAAGEGRWVTTLMYTEDLQQAESFKDVLLRWQSQRTQKGSRIWFRLEKSRLFIIELL